MTTTAKTPTTAFDYHPTPRYSPWDSVQETDILMWGKTADGTAIPILWQVHTAGHGGTHVHPQLAAKYFQRLPAECHAYGGSNVWFEEDCESSVPLFIFYNGLTADSWLIRSAFPREKLLESIVRWLPDTATAVKAIAQCFDDALMNAGGSLRAPL